MKSVIYLNDIRSVKDLRNTPPLVLDRAVLCSSRLVSVKRGQDNTDTNIRSSQCRLRTSFVESQGKTPNKKGHISFLKLP